MIVKSPKKLKIKPKTLRKIHSYLSLIFCFLFCFYLLTGFFLNHPTWFESDASFVVKESDLTDDLSLVNALSHHSITLSTTDLQQLKATSEFEITGPGWSKVISLDGGSVEIEAIDYGFLATINDLHKNRHAHVIWTLASDIFIFFTLIMCITGIWISFKNLKAKNENMKLLLAGGLALLLLVFIIPTANSGEMSSIKLEASIEIPRFEKKTEKPYIALFSENSVSQFQTHMVLRERYKWVKDLKTFWRNVARSDRALVDAHSGATRNVGVFTKQFELEIAADEKLENVIFYLEVVREKGGRELLTLTSLSSLARAAPYEQTCIGGSKEIIKFCLQRVNE